MRQRLANVTHGERLADPGLDQIEDGRVVERPTIDGQLHLDDVLADEPVRGPRGLRRSGRPDESGEQPERPPTHQKAYRTRTSSA